MPASSMMPTWRDFYNPEDPRQPGRYDRRITPFLQNVSRRACTHPIHTISFFAILASSMYIGLLETGLFEPSQTVVAGRVDLKALTAGSRRMHLGPETAWKWQLEEPNSSSAQTQDFSLVTLNFGESSFGGATPVTPSLEAIPTPANSNVETLPPSADRLSSLTQESTLAFSVPFDETSAFLAAIKEISAGHEQEPAGQESDDVPEEKRWIMRAARAPSKTNSLVDWVQNSWTAFIDLLKNAETLDIVIMALGYLSMHLTFVSLFVSMRRMGSNFWLATTVLFSSAFALLFGLMVTIKMGVPVNVVLLSEGLPFLVVTVGFEKPIILTQAVLSAALHPRRSDDKDSPTEKDAPLTIQHAVETAVAERGFGIVRDYAVEIAILSAGAMSGIQGGLRQFCFLAAWTLFFDCILLFTFYTSILTVKLEVNRIKRHVALRKALEEDGVSRSVAEKVASSNDWPRRDGSVEKSDGTSIFGHRVRDSSIPRFKVLMVSGFIIINVLNLCTMPFRSGRSSSVVATTGLSSVVSQPPMDPFKVAKNGLETIFNSAVAAQRPTSITVLQPVKYELQYPSVHYGSADSEWSFFDGNYTDGLFSTMGGKVVEGVLKSFEDPVLSKWIIIALAMSLVLNGYLFNAARWSIKEPDHQDREEARQGLGVDGAAKQPQAVPKISEPVPNGHSISSLDKLDSALEGIADGVPGHKRTREECEELLRQKKAPLLNDAELVELSLRGKIPGYALEKTLENKTRAVKIRRAVIARTPATSKVTSALATSKLPYEHFDYDRVFGACCENVVGYMPLPLGVAGPIVIDGESYFLPMATTEGVLVASTSRGCKAINAGGGAITVLTADGMTRGPCVGFETLARAAEAKLWLDSEEGEKVMKDAFNSTSRFARLRSIKCALAGTYLYIRFKTTTGDAMGMNMISKGVEHALSVMRKESGFDDMAIISVSGNYCTDKKPAAINWIDGRGKSVVAEAIIPGDVVRSVLKSDVDALVELNISKNLIGSAMAGSIGGFNAHAANIVTAIFLATGQDPAQNVESSNCITVMKK